MSQLKLGTRENRTEFRPGDEIIGAVGWQLDQPAKAIEVRLFWYTKGKGTEDARVLDTIRFDQPATEGAESFRFTAPAEPYSFSGKLISLIWALELVVEPGNKSARLDLTISPTGAEITLQR